jgi:hypothetical protein
MHRSQHQVEARQKVIGIIERAVGFDLHFRGVQNKDLIAKLLLDLLDLRGLLLVLFDAQSACDAEADRMVGERDDLDAALCRGARHLQHGQFPVAPRGMHLQVRFDVFDLDQLREFICLRGLHLAAVFAQLGRDPRQAERFVHFLFGRAEDFPFPPLTFANECSDNDSPLSSAS